MGITAMVFTALIVTHTHSSSGDNIFNCDSQQRHEYQSFTQKEKIYMVHMPDSSSAVVRFKSENRKLAFTVGDERQINIPVGSSIIEKYNPYEKVKCDKYGLYKQLDRKDPK